MKPLLLETLDNQALLSVGRASVQIVHDLKNQINGLKLYATFLRKRMEKNERPTDELDTVNKLIGGLDRAATDLSVIVQFGHPVELKKQAGIDLHAMMNSVVTDLNAHPPATDASKGLVVLDSAAEPLLGQFDPAALSDALRSISVGAIKLRGRNHEQGLIVRIEGRANDSGRDGIIEWGGLEATGHDPFNSFVGADGLRMALAARVVEAHGGSAERNNGSLRVRLPLEP